MEFHLRCEVDTVCCDVIEMQGFCRWPDIRTFVCLDRSQTNNMTHHQQGQLLFHRETTN
jgi:hypothetical protein